MEEALPPLLQQRPYRPPPVAQYYTPARGPPCSHLEPTLAGKCATEGQRPVHLIQKMEKNRFVPLLTVLAHTCAAAFHKTVPHRSTSVGAVLLAFHSCYIEISAKVLLSPDPVVQLVHPIQSGTIVGLSPSA